MRFPTLTLAAATVAVLGCSSTSSVRREPTTRTTVAHAQGAGTMGGLCPMDVEGTTVRSVDVQGGVALDFETTSDEVGALRDRVRRMADMQNRQPGSGLMLGGAMMVPAPRAIVENTRRGARLVLRPNDRSQLGSLREHARMEAMRMQRGECPMMSYETTA